MTEPAASTVSSISDWSWLRHFPLKFTEPVVPNDGIRRAQENPRFLTRLALDNKGDVDDAQDVRVSGDNVDFASLAGLGIDVVAGLANFKSGRLNAEAVRISSVKPCASSHSRTFGIIASPRTTEKQDIAVDVLELETTQTVIGVFQWLGQLDIARSKFGRQCVRIRDVNECVPPGDTLFDISLIVRQWSHANVFEQDLRTAPANDAEEDVVRSRPWKVISNPSRSR